MTEPTKKAPAKAAAPKAEPAAEERPEPIISPHVETGAVAEGDLVEVRTTMRPDQPLLVSTAERNDLEAQGLLTKDVEDNDAR